MPSREEDERLLRWVRARIRGIPPAEIARADAVTPQNVSTQTTNVLRADLKESGEKAGVVRKEYWS